MSSSTRSTASHALTALVALLAGLALGVSLDISGTWRGDGGDAASSRDPLAEASLLAEPETAPPPQLEIAPAGGAPQRLPMSFRDIAERSFPSVVFIVLQYPNRSRVSEATGFVVQRGIVLTNFHVIDGTVSGEVNLIGQKRRLPIQGVAASDPNRDLVLLSVPDLDAPPLELGGEQVAVGDKVFVVGNPNGLEGTFSDGMVSGKRDFNDFDLLQISAPISPGSSGGPVLDVRGRVVGIAKGSWERGQNLNFAIPSEYAKTLLASGADVLPLAKVTHPKYAAARRQLPAALASEQPGGIIATLRQFLRL